MPLCPELRIDARRHVADEAELGVGDIKQRGGRGFQKGESDKLFDREGASIGGPGVHALFEEPHAVHGFVEADAVADSAEVGEVVGERGW